ncbi:MAG: hypothetical protein HQM03_01230 [Magnetococcales bacterium]|nr:hypothetical protein [Magnetococcales bacterium]
MTLRDPSSLLRLNLGCGFDRQEGWINVDHSQTCGPDQVWDLERLPWPWEDNSVGAVRLFNILEHLGPTRDGFLDIIKELNRICAPGAIIYIVVPHPRHNDFIGDPTHVRPISVDTLKAFDAHFNQFTIANQTSESPLGLQIGVDLYIQQAIYIIDDAYHDTIFAGDRVRKGAAKFLHLHNNVIKLIYMEVEVVKGREIPDRQVKVTINLSKG